MATTHFFIYHTFIECLCLTLRTGTGYYIPNNEHERQGPIPIEASFSKGMWKEKNK